MDKYKKNRYYIKNTILKNYKLLKIYMKNNENFINCINGEIN